MSEQLSDSQLWPQVGEAALILVAILAFVSWLVLMVCVISLQFNTVPGALPKFFSLRNWVKPDSRRSWMLLNRNNVIFYPDILTPTGRILRRCVFFAAAAFVVCLAIFVCIFIFMLPADPGH